MMPTVVAPAARSTQGSAWAAAMPGTSRVNDSRPISRTSGRRSASIPGSRRQMPSLSAR